MCFADQTTHRRQVLPRPSGSVQTFEVDHYGTEISQAEQHTHKQAFNNEKGSLPNEMLDQNIAVLSHWYYFLATQKPGTHILVTLHLSPVTHKEYSICQVSYQRIFEAPNSKPTGLIAWRNQHCQRHTVTSLYQYCCPTSLPPVSFTACSKGYLTLKQRAGIA